MRFLASMMAVSLAACALPRLVQTCGFALRTWRRGGVAVTARRSGQRRGRLRGRPRLAVGRLPSPLPMLPAAPHSSRRCSRSGREPARAAFPVPTGGGKEG
jgi:hypothetical protein